MNEGTRFGPTVHLLKVVQDSDAYDGNALRLP